eukprot:COSAG01_NODE_17198_length_1170_cov_620.306256_1_plen_23_part_10
MLTFRPALPPPDPRVRSGAIVGP